MKKIFAMMLCLFILLGCSQKDNDTANTNEINQSSEKTKDDIDDWYTRFEDNLKNKNINYKNKTNIDVSQIGAKEGYRYDGDNGSIEVYRFEDGEDFNRIVKEKKLKKDGKDVDVEIKDHMVILTENLENDILDIFRNMK
jgi:hypothetical protein